MTTRHIHIKGRVQGVGFRPAVFRVATSMHLKGRVANTADGVHIEINADDKDLALFLSTLQNQLPPMAVISDLKVEEVAPIDFPSFSIVKDDVIRPFDMWITPDLAMCDDCRKSLHSKEDKRHAYAFTTCLNCGPRYSIIRALPYEREFTSMAYLHACPSCEKEYQNPVDNRFYSQTNSCPSCAVQMKWWTSGGVLVSKNQDHIIDLAVEALKQGKIIAVKGIGGYLLMCDAVQENAIIALRHRKHRPHKPFAILYPGIEMIKADTTVTAAEERWLKSVQSPIVLCKLKNQPATGICCQQLAPGLAQLGVMLPYSPLLELLSTQINRPLVATSGNISGGPIEFKDDNALKNLSDIADYFLTSDREIVVPQDDSVMRVSRNENSIIIRRSRGFAPAIMKTVLSDSKENILAFGADMKSSFALYDGHNLNVSQYLGHLGSFETNEVFRSCLDHLLQLTKTRVQKVLADLHPAYYSSQMAEEYAAAARVPLIKVQHHRAHFAAVLAENNLLKGDRPILGLVWDGTGYGDDGQIWGSECFVYHDYEMIHYHGLNYFAQLAGDKMSQEPRLSALSVLGDHEGCQNTLKDQFTEQEWNFFVRAKNQPAITTSSMGRFIDAFAAITGVCNKQSYEGQAAMLLEALAWKEEWSVPQQLYRFIITDTGIDHSALPDQIISDLNLGLSTGEMSRKFWFSLAVLALDLADFHGIKDLALSGGVFQNDYLITAIQTLKRNDMQIYLHQQLSPNDENIAVGQMAWYQMTEEKKLVESIKITATCV
ncbi:MAG: carbamoyltransferase HypF [Saprospiraceae bacterium]|nr:carbamoyltransferase HypF [Saprospiraceae bacterium]